MLSVIVPVRNGKQLTANCLLSLLHTFTQLRAEATTEFILVDDHSDPDNAIVQLFEDFRRQISSKVTILHFRERRHYAWSVAAGLAAARGDALLVSFDMILTPAYVQTVQHVAALDGRYGIVRGTSQYVDCFPKYQIAPPLPARSMQDVMNFAAYVAQYHGLAIEEDQLLTGDAMLVTRAVLDKIGSFDTRYPYGYFADIDFGIRARRAGFKMVCAKGAWLHHVGYGSYRDEAAVRKVDMNVITQERMAKVQVCYDSFRDKWDKSLSPRYIAATSLGLDKLIQKPDAPELFQPFVSLEDPLIEVR